jgi:hypothetical protein
MLAAATKGALAEKSPLGALAGKSPLATFSEKSPLGALAGKSPLATLAEKSPLGALAGKSPLGALADPKGALGGLLKKSPLGALAAKSPLGSLLSASIGPTQNQGPPLAPHPNKNITEGHLREKCPCIYGKCAERLDELYEAMHRDPGLRMSHSDHQYIEQQLNKMFPEKCECIRGYTRGLTSMKKRKISNKRLRAQFDGILCKCGSQQGNTAELAVKGASEKAGGYRSVTARKRKTSRRNRRRSYKIKYKN